MEPAEHTQSISEIAEANPQCQPELLKALEITEGIVATLREALLVLDSSLKIIWANNSFYKLFSLKRQETEGRFIYEIDDHRWDIPNLRELLLEIISKNTQINDFELESDFRKIGRRTMVLNACHLHDGNTQRILLTVEDVTQRKRIEVEKATSELRYRRLFETAQDGILILNAETGQITDVNPFLINMLGYSRNEFIGKKLWEFGAFVDAKKSKEAYKELQENSYIRYEDLPLQTKSGERREVEFVSNVYLVNGEKVIQCNIRDISERKRLERSLEFSANHDLLTGLPNRQLFNDHYLLALAAAKRYPKKLAIMVLDIDHFKDINDGLGHNSGDQMLKEMGERLSAILRKTDTLARLGGDEFAVLLTEVAESEYIDKVARKILESARKPFTLKNHEIKVSVSIGISNYPDDGEEIEALLKYADIAMYQAKKIGRNNHVCYRPSISL